MRQNEIKLKEKKKKKDTKIKEQQNAQIKVKVFEVLMVDVKITFIYLVFDENLKCNSLDCQRL